MSFVTSKLFWVILSLFSAVFDACVHLLTKKALTSSSQYLVPAALCLLSGIFCLIALFFIGFPTVGWDFFQLVIIVSLMAGTGMVCFTTGLEKTEVSYAIPLLCFIPLLSALWGWVSINEQVSKLGLLGVVIVMLGAYMLEFHRMKKGIFEPIKAIVENKNARLIIFASFLWSITSVIDKVGVQKGSALMWSCSVSLGMGLLIASYSLLFKKITLKQIYKAPPLTFLFLGLSYAFMHICQMYAVEVGQVSYVLSLKRLGILISVIVGSLLFKEHHFRERMIASMVMVLGVCLIILYA